MGACEQRIEKDFKAGKISAQEKESRLDYCMMYSGYDGDAPVKEDWEAVEVQMQCVTAPCDSFIKEYKHKETGETITVADYNRLFNVSSQGDINLKIAENTALNNEKQMPVIGVIAPLGLTLVAIYLAYKHKRGFWGYAGYLLLAGIVAGGIAKTSYELKNRNVELKKQLS